MQKLELNPGWVVQLSPDTNFPGCFMLVTESKSWGAQGFIAVPTDLGKPPRHAYYRAEHKDMELVGRAGWVPEDMEPPGDDLQRALMAADVEVLKLGVSLSRAFGHTNFDTPEGRRRSADRVGWALDNLQAIRRDIADALRDLDADAGEENT